MGELVAQPQRTPGPRQVDLTETGQAEFVICDYQWSGQLAVCGLSHHAAIRPVSITSTINGSFRSNSAQRPS